MLFGRDQEVSTLTRLLDEAREGRGSALVVRGPAGIGKTALLGATAGYAEARGFTTLRATGIESEAGLPFAALQMLLAPVRDRIEALPAPQADALRGAFGLAEPVGSDDARFLLGLGLLTLLGDLAEEAPVLCLVDDTQWVDGPSAAALAFAARRLRAERVAVVFAARGADEDGARDEDGSAAQRLTGLPTLAPTALAPDQAAAILAEHAPDLAAAVRARVVADSSGNPLALKELASALDQPQRTGSAPLPPALAAPDAV
ncbi:MAG: ATP-binding protein, partial [Streptomycetaceae bacterium]|nr:ATP-binding protein [Streptomycetaceae bacterium]